MHSKRVPTLFFQKILNGDSGNTITSAVGNLVKFRQLSFITLDNSADKIVPDGATDRDGQALALDNMDKPDSGPGKYSPPLASMGHLQQALLAAPILWRRDFHKTSR